MLEVLYIKKKSILIQTGRLLNGNIVEICGVGKLTHGHYLHNGWRERSRLDERKLIEYKHWTGKQPSSTPPKKQFHFSFFHRF